MDIKAIIVDDESHARQALRHLLQAHSEIDILAECENGLAAVKSVHEVKPQVMFLDIQMPKLDGFDVLDLLGDSAPLTVFVTAHDEYAIQAFENNALDYLLKPISRERLALTVERLEQRLQNGIDSPMLADNLLHAHLQKQAPVNRILVRDKGDVYVIATADVVAIEAADDYVVIHTEKQNHIKQERLGNMESLLDARQFCRIHRSTIINLDYLSGIESEGKDSRFVLLKNGSQFAISRNGYSRLIQVL
ncbi:LytR/AlgR family response regulator transcription factor [Teredinibacter haidensis]|uniref:LytR/AlgR family response regulator transcription factor n=1 Tax=Teredinibacter haidensis TaxID=2731755 RepID=UPI000948DEFF|nr:response regulator [Teredinibacter haidensis]